MRATSKTLAQLIAVASGKGGVGKTLISLGMGWSLTRLGYRVVVVDLDFGVGNLQISAGLGKVAHSLDEFVRGATQDVNTLLTPVPNNDKLWILSGAGRRSSATHFAPARRRALIAQLQWLNADMAVLDLGAGCSTETIDYFQAAEHRVVVATADLASMTALTAFLKKVLIRELIDHLTSIDPALAFLAEHEFTHVGEIYGVVEREKGGSWCYSHVRAAIKQFRPAVVLNRVGSADHALAERMRRNLERQFNVETKLIGRIPEDEAVTQCRRLGRNVFYAEPRAAFAKAMAACANYWHENYYLKSTAAEAQHEGAQAGSVAKLKYA